MRRFKLTAAPILTLTLALLACVTDLRAKEEAPRALLERHRCTICHDDIATRAGPSWAEIAKLHRKDLRAMATLTSVIRNGRHGDSLWPMPPSVVTLAEAQAMAREILRH